MTDCILINNPPNFSAGLAHYPPGLLEVKNLYCNVNIGMKNSKGFIQSSTSAIWPFRKLENNIYARIRLKKIISID